MNYHDRLPGNRPDGWEFLCNSQSLKDFSAIGVLPAGQIPVVATQIFNSWLEREFHAQMSYLCKNIDLRYNTAHPDIVPNASAVVVAALPYGKGIETKGIWRYIARYARGRDYHRTMKRKLKLLVSSIQSQFPKASCRVFVDSAPIMERSLALMAGLGTIGKNGAIIVEGVGPSVILGEIVCTNVPVPSLIAPNTVLDLCGDCTLCVDACPTQAIVDRATVDARRCLSYWSIETPKSPSGIISSNFSQIFGCDICTSVCPHNQDVESSLEKATSSIPLPLSLTELLRSDEQMIQKALCGTAMHRTGAAKLKDNTIIVLKNKRSE